MSLLDYYISVSNIAGSYAFTSKACVQPKPVCIDLTSLWIWYWLSRPAALIELRQSERSFKRWSNAMEEDSHRLWNILWSSLVWFSNATSSLMRWEKSWYRTRPKSQNAHLLTLKGNNNNKKNHFLCFSSMAAPISRRVVRPPSLPPLCSPQEAEHARAEQRSLPAAAVRKVKVIFSPVTQRWEGNWEKSERGAYFSRPSPST